MEMFKKGLVRNCSLKISSTKGGVYVFIYFLVKIIRKNGNIQPLKNS